jgi:thiamine-monophosphate kinase
MGEQAGDHSADAAPTGELAFIRWLRRRTGRHLQMLLGPGDDAAVVRTTPGRPCLLAADMILEGVHFDLSAATPAQVGRKALAINLSDLAAMAARPVAALVSVALPRGRAAALATETLDGMQALAEEFHMSIVGGDTNSWDGPLVIDVSVLGEAGPNGPLLRSTAKPGDWILVTGTLGGSRAGKHLDFTPRVREALLLHEGYHLHAMIDISDGLSTDLHHILEESRCGAELRADAIPISDAAKNADDGRSPLEHALHDGEDFELLFTTPAEQAREILADPPLRIPVSKIGKITSETGAWMVDNSGARHELLPHGWQHAFDG